jgi:hypothetical protein
MWRDLKIIDPGVAIQKFNKKGRRSKEAFKLAEGGKHATIKECNVVGVVYQKLEGMYIG